jgi:predicted N-acetyltransferase YhbS
MAFTFAHLADCERHLPVIAAWQQTEFGYLAPSITVEQREARLRESLHGAGLPLTLVALTEDGSPAGAATLAARTITHPHLTPWLSTVVVPPAYRGRGIASALSLHVADAAARLGFPTIHLFTPHNESLYRRLGWVTIETAQVGGTPVAIMARPTAA